ncbi:MAG: hypothetical protein ACTSPI_16715 [Candidatus Heimdallarchaeaceae archaeon]
MTKAMKKKNEWKYKANLRFEVRDKYCVQGDKGRNLKRPPNAVYFSAANTEEHELHKAVAGLTLNKYGVILESDNLRSAIAMLSEVIRSQAVPIKESQKWFITEAQEKQGCFGERTKYAPGKRRDLVILDDHTPVEWETDQKRALRHEHGVKVIVIERGD